MITAVQLERKNMHFFASDQVTPDISSSENSPHSSLSFSPCGTSSEGSRSPQQSDAADSGRSNREGRRRNLIKFQHSVQSKADMTTNIKSAAKKLERDDKDKIFGRLKAFFRESDSDSDGFLTMTELTTTLRKYGYNGTDEEIRKFFNLADTSGDQLISMDEYMSVMRKAPTLSQREATMKRVFTRFDKDNSGSIEKDELRTVFDEMGQFFTEDEIQRMMDQADSDQSGSLEYEEFMKIVMGKTATL